MRRVRRAVKSAAVTATKKKKRMQYFTNATKFVTDDGVRSDKTYIFLFPLELCLDQNLPVTLNML